MRWKKWIEEMESKVIKPNYLKKQSDGLWMYYNGWFV